jgi:penicillin-binding protein 2
VRPPADVDALDARLRLRRGKILVGIWAVLVLALVVRLWHLQIAQGSEMERAARRTRIRPLPVAAPRGSIRDRNGKVLATNRPTYVAYILPDADLNLIGPRLAPLLGMTDEELRERFDEGRIDSYRPVAVAWRLDTAAVSRIEERKPRLPGVMVAREEERYYPVGAAAAHVLGYVGQVSEADLGSDVGRGLEIGDMIGKFGVERSAEVILRGSAGRRYFEVDAAGRLARSVGSDPATPGTDVVLSLDADLQQAAWEALGEHVGAIVALDPSTGEILAMVSKPDFDPNHFIPRVDPKVWATLNADPHHPLQNRAIQNCYPPGSTFKPITLIAGLMENAITPETTITCQGGVRVGRRTFSCWKHHGGGVDPVRAVAESCDTFFYRVGLKLGNAPMAEWARRLGLGAPTGVDLPGEQEGFVPTTEWKEGARHERWYPGDSANMAIGQGFVQASPLQMALMAAAVANGGYMVRPHVLKRRRVESTSLGIRTEDLSVAQRGMEQAVAGGTAWRARIPGVRAAGKTGTAQDPPRKEPHAWFVGYAPAEGPRIAVCVFCEQGRSGGEVAAPIGGWLMGRYLGIDMPAPWASAAVVPAEGDMGATGR